jgi:hypothetical protein
MTRENARSGARRVRPRRGTLTRALDTELGTTWPPRPARRPPLERGGRHLPSGEPALNLVARFRPGHARTTRYGSPGTSLDLLDPLALAAPLTRQVGFQGRQQLGHNLGPLIGPKLGTAQALRRGPPRGTRAPAPRRHPDDNDLHASGAAGSPEDREPVRRKKWR